MTRTTGSEAAVRPAHHCSLSALIDQSAELTPPHRVVVQPWGMAGLRSDFRGPYVILGVFSPDLSASQRLVLRAGVTVWPEIVATTLLADVALCLLVVLFSLPPLALALAIAALAAALTANGIAKAALRALERQVAYTTCDVDDRADGGPLDALLTRIESVEHSRRQSDAYVTELRALYEDVSAWPRWGAVYDPPPSGPSGCEP